LRAKITIDFGANQKAQAVARSLAPDNQPAAGMKINTKATGRKVQTCISFNGRIQTLISTIDDLLKCTQAAEKTLDVAQIRSRSSKHPR
jgi:hypothetical protein